MVGVGLGAGVLVGVADGEGVNVDVAGGTGVFVFVGGAGDTFGAQAPKIKAISKIVRMILIFIKHHILHGTG